MSPLAERLRPKTLEEFYGQRNLLSEGMPLVTAIKSGRLHSMILWGPPGTGKTTLAYLVAKSADAEFINMSAVMSGIKDIRSAIVDATENAARGSETIIFVDEVHRFNKSQQDAFLPHIESGLFYFIGATTENPAFEVNNALMSRVAVYNLESLDARSVLEVLERALGLDMYEHVTVVDGVLTKLAELADGDARRALNLFELAVEASSNGLINMELLGRVAKSASYRRFDKNGDYFYDQLSALHKSIRGSNPDAGLYWFARLLDGGCDLAIIARRLTRIASEDIGVADPRALSVAIDSWEAWRRMGSPEGDLALAQALVYMACAPKSNSVYNAFSRAVREVRNKGSEPVPL
ncbi:MAG TPA: replication-associated recombination protein A, partial [Dehalococcoidia bacterium]|nr:replication-associated recombination protein A [Dehalococcoidia bacterium]